MSSPINRFINELNPNNLRYLFYLVTPNETTYYRVENVPQFIDRTVSWFLVMVLLETLILYLTGRKDAIALNDSITSITSGILSQLPKFEGRVLNLIAYTYIYENFRLFDVAYDSVWLWIFAFLSQDLAFYLAHRAIHEAGIFWSFHQMHHSSEYYNLTTALRKGCFQELGITFFECLQAFITPPPMFITHKALNLLYQFWIHNELIPKLGFLEYILNTPSHHRVHHGRNPYCIDRNYGGVLIVWDRIFGTFIEEKDDEKPVYGLVENVKTFNPIYLQMFEFKALGWDKPHMKNDEHKDVFPRFWNKIKTIFMPPGYFPGLETRQFFWWRYMKDPTSGIPEVEKSVVKYNPPLTLYETFYVVFQFVVANMAYLQFNEARLRHDWMTFWAYLVLIVSTIQAIGYFLNKSSNAGKIEAIRLILIAVYCLYSKNMMLLFIALFFIAYNLYFMKKIKF